MVESEVPVGIPLARASAQLHTPGKTERQLREESRPYGKLKGDGPVVKSVVNVPEKVV